MGAADAKLVDNLSMSYMVDYPLKLWVRPTEKPRIGKIRCGDYPLKHRVRPDAFISSKFLLEGGLSPQTQGASD
jgi:hypothetical protein